MRIDNEPKLGFKDVLIRPKRSEISSRKEVVIERTIKFKHTGRTWTGVPVVAANMSTVGTYDMARAMNEFRMLTVLHKFIDKDPARLAHFMRTIESSVISIGMSEKELDWLQAVHEEYAQIEKIVTPEGKTHFLGFARPFFICLDVANGYMEAFVKFVEKVRNKFPGSIIMAGNVVTGEMAEELVLHGADIIKTGIGPGLACTTRRVTGVGYPQLSAIAETSDHARGVGGLVCADGGCREYSDIAKAFGAGAHFVMLGSMLAGFDESGGEVIEQDGEKFMEFYGMSSETAMKKFYGGVAEHRASEGKRMLVPYKGPVRERLREMCGAIRSACSYVGAKELGEFRSRTTFVKVY